MSKLVRNTIPVRITRTTQPQVACEIDPRNGSNDSLLPFASYTNSGLISVAPRAAGLAFIGNGSTKAAYKNLAKPVTIANGLVGTLVVVFRKQTSFTETTTIAGLGSTSGDSGNTLFRLMGGDAQTQVKLQIQDGAGGLFYNYNSTGVAVDDKKWHTCVVTYDINPSVGVSSMYIDGISAGSSTCGSSGVTSTTFQSISACGSLRGGSVIAQGPFDVALVHNIPRYLSAGELKSVSQNPWQIFAPLPKQVWVPA